MPKDNTAPTFVVEDIELTRERTTANAPVASALAVAINALEPGQSFKVAKKGQLQTARRVAKELGIEITTSESSLRVGLRPAKAKK